MVKIVADKFGLVESQIQRVLKELDGSDVELCNCSKGGLRRALLNSQDLTRWSAYVEDVIKGMENDGLLILQSMGRFGQVVRVNESSNVFPIWERFRNR